MKTMQELIENLQKCPSFSGCNLNLCPLDYELHLRDGGSSEECKWMREEKPSEIQGKKFISGGRPMPDKLLKFVPKKNVEYLNEISRNRWTELNAQQA